MARPKKNPDTLESLDNQIQLKVAEINNLKKEIKNLEQKKAILIMNQLENKAKEKNISVDDLIKNI